MLICDSNTLYLYSEDIAENEVLQIIEDFRRESEIRLGIVLPNTTVVNIFQRYNQESKDYTNTGKGFVRLSNSELKPLLVGADLSLGDKKISFRHAEIETCSEDFNHNVLYSKNFTDITQEELINEFSKFSSSKDYPNVRMNQRSIFVIFSPDTHDAEFALLMTKKLKIRNHTLKFSLSQRK